MAPRRLAFVACSSILLGCAGPSETGAEYPVEPDPTTTTDNAAITDLVQSRIPELEVCYVESLQTNPELAGEMAYTVIVHPDGTVYSATVDRDTVGDPTTLACVVERIEAWTFPPVEGELGTEVSFAVTYAPDED